ncbi:MAG TPA: hypothetical protein VJL82_07190 [Rhizomicrobium sp.]|nr:hypothetical protein [Rhizomicrobium sp.]
MKKMMFAVIAALCAGSALAPAAAQDYGYRHNRNYGVPEVPRAPQAPRPPRAPGANDSEQGFTPYRPIKPYESYKPPRHYNIHTGRWE